ncbi:unknown [Bacteroides sp. CAG:462]|nr:unknown [Bacteroides sp. CAG:462]
MVDRIKNEMHINLDLYSMLLSLYITHCILVLYLI